MNFVLVIVSHSYSHTRADIGRNHAYLILVDIKMICIRLSMKIPDMLRLYIFNSIRCISYFYDKAWTQPWNYHDSQRHKNFPLSAFFAILTKIVRPISHIIDLDGYQISSTNLIDYCSSVGLSRPNPSSAYNDQRDSQSLLYEHMHSTNWS